MFHNLSLGKQLALSDQLTFQTEERLSVWQHLLDNSRYESLLHSSTVSDSRGQLEEQVFWAACQSACKCVLMCPRTLFDICAMEAVKKAGM